MENFYKPKIIKYIRSYKVRLLPTKEQEQEELLIKDVCGFEINRDINAAINLEKYGIFNLSFTLNECNSIELLCSVGFCRSDPNGSRDNNLNTSSMKLQYKFL